MASHPPREIALSAHCASERRRRPAGHNCPMRRRKSGWKDLPALSPPPDSKANIAIGAAESYLGVPYVWGGASRSGVDCSGLVMLAYEAAGIDFPHYSGAPYEDPAREPPAFL